MASSSIVTGLLDHRAAGLVDRDWVARAVSTIRAEQARSADTHLLRLPLPGSGVDLYLKDESTHPTGSLKHRLARSLFLYHLCSGAIGPLSTVVEASSGSTAVSEAYFARLLGIPFVAVVPRSTSESKIRLIEREGGRCHLVDRADEVYAEAQRLAAATGGVYLDQFTYAERVTDWRGNNNIAETVFAQLAQEPYPVPHWIVVGAGTGGTSATLGRYLRYRGVATELAVVDPEGSAFFEGYRGIDPAVGPGSRIEGIGRPRSEPSFLPAVVDRMLRVPDAGSLAAATLLADRTGLEVGPSTGTNLYAALYLACELHQRGEQGSIVTLICDRRERYRETYASPEWVRDQGWDPAGHLEVLERAWETGVWVQGS